MGSIVPRECIEGKWRCIKCKFPINHGRQLFEYHCVTCNELFVKNFSHPAYNFDYPECWECLESLKPNEKAYNYYISIFVKIPPPPPVIPATDEEIFGFNSGG